MFFANSHNSGKSECASAIIRINRIVCFYYACVLAVRLCPYIAGGCFHRAFQRYTITLTTYSETMHKD